MRKGDTKAIALEARCGVCGRIFVPAPEHVYKDKRHPYGKVCSWSCVCASEKMKEERRAKIKAERDKRRAGDAVGCKAIS